MVAADTTGLDRVGSGKVRELYRVDDEHLLIVASDRISAYDWVLDTPIPDKGRVLTALSAWWFAQLADVAPHHLVAVDGPRIPAAVAGRAMLVRALDMLPVECVARGYLAGSGVTDYAASGGICGVPLSPGLLEGDRLPEPIFTPATKAERGAHDQNVSYQAIAAAIGDRQAAAVRDATLALYGRAAAITAERGIILADTKFEFGVDAGRVLRVADEVLTPDSSRFWPADGYSPGGPQPSFDKQYARDWLVKDSGWDRVSPPPPLPAAVVAATRERYLEAYTRITGLDVADWPGAG